jgi:hypothetical protein
MSESTTPADAGTVADSESIREQIERKRSIYEYGIEPHKDPEVLRYLYHDEELSQAEIGRLCDISQPTVSEWMDKFDIEARPPMDERNRSISASRQPREKVQYHIPSGDGETERIYRHQLVALLAEDQSGDWAYNVEDIFGGDSHIHHEMAAPVAVDIPENLAVVTPREHTHIHGSSGPALIDRVEEVLSEIYEGYDGEPDPVDIPDQHAVRKQRLKREQWDGCIDSQPADD